MENSATNAAAPFGVLGMPAILRIAAWTGGALATAKPISISIVTCIVNATRSQKPAPNHCADWSGELPRATLAPNTTASAASASANASGNHRSNHAERRRPRVGSQPLFGCAGCGDVTRKSYVTSWLGERCLAEQPRREIRQV